MVIKAGCPHALPIAWGRDTVWQCTLDDGPCDSGRAGICPAYEREEDAQPMITYALAAATPDGVPAILTIPQAIAAGLIDPPTAKSPAPGATEDGADENNLPTI